MSPVRGQVRRSVQSLTDGDKRAHSYINKNWKERRHQTASAAYSSPACFHAVNKKENKKNLCSWRLLLQFIFMTAKLNLDTREAQSNYASPHNSLFLRIPQSRCTWHSQCSWHSDWARVETWHAQREGLLYCSCQPGCWT